MSLLFLLVVLINVVHSVYAEDSLRLCDSANDVNYTSYNSTVTQNCGCKEESTCIRKCCQKGFYHYHDEDPDTGLFVSVCVKNVSNSFSVPIYDGKRQVSNETESFLVGMLSCNNVDVQYFKMDKSDRNQRFYIQKNGSLYYPHFEKIYSNARYCIDEEDGLTAYLCFSPQPPEHNVETYIHVAAKLISLPFLLMTGLVYILLPERNLHRNSVISHVFSLLPTNLLLAIGQYTVIEDDILCLSLGYSVVFFMLVSFFWMNVICIDIWLAFSGMRKFYVQGKKRQMIFVIASLYSWGLPAIDILTVILLNTFGDEDATYYPGIGVHSCFLKTGLPTVLYYFGPVLVLIIINLVLFVATVINIQRVKKETKIVQTSRNKNNSHIDDDKLKLYWKLLFVMGLNPMINTHIIQFFSWWAGKDIDRDTAVYIFYVKDFSHAFYGVIIFLIFICQKKVWVSLKERFGSKSNLSKTNTKTTSSTATSSENSTGIRLKGIQNITENTF